MNPQWSAHCEEIGQRIARVREQRGWSQTQLARKMNYTQTAISYWEKGKRTVGLHDLLHLAEVLGVPLAALLPVKASPRGEVIAELSATIDSIVAAAVDFAAELRRMVQTLQGTLQVLAQTPEDTPDRPVQ